MSRVASAQRRVLAPLAAGVLAGLVATVPAFAQTAPAATSSSAGCAGIHFDLSNPSAGDFLAPGGLVVNGVAFDTRAAQGGGIDRVSFFLNSREQGGQSIGAAVPGLVQGPFGAGSFTTTIQLPSGMSGGADIVAYARSTVTGQESVISVPVLVGKQPSSSTTSSSVSSQFMCLGGVSATSGTTTTTTTTAPAPAAVAGPQATSSIHLEVGNPSSGDSVKAGGLAMQGIAYDASASSGLGVDRVDIFLDSRDAGGVRLGSGVLGSVNPRAAAGSQFANAGWRAVAQLPTNNTGLHTLFVYAHSSVSGMEAVAQIPITVVP